MDNRNEQDALVASFIEIRLKDSQDFLKIRETLTRIGVASKHENVLYQSVHILHKKGKYYLVHFKNCFALDGKPTDFTDNDKARTNTIANLLASWGLLELVNPDRTKEPIVPINQIKIIHHKDKVNWKLQSKYTIGIKK